nr:MAG TPA: hypothetical protein [Caudoviricetes sp.]
MLSRKPKPSPANRYRALPASPRPKTSIPRQPVSADPLHQTRAQTVFQ